MLRKEKICCLTAHPLGRQNQETRSRRSVHEEEEHHMKRCIYAVTVASTATMAVGQTALMDQIGDDDGSGVGGTTMACQYFEDAYAQYSIAVCDNFDTAGTAAVSSVEGVVSGWNGWVDPSGITAYEVNLYSSPDAAGASLTGDVGSQMVDAADAEISGTWAGEGYLIKCNVSLNTAAGTNWVSMIPDMDFGTSGQSGTVASTSGPGDDCVQANPLGGFGFGPWQYTGNDAAYRVSGEGAPTDPCDDPLPELCPTDVNGDGAVNVTDLLTVIGDWGNAGDGTFRPAGDCAPLPNGDCVTNVADVLAVISGWGGVCVPTGACCYSDGTCEEGATETGCGDAGGNYLGDDSTCDACVTGACCIDADTCNEMTQAGCTALGGSYRGNGSECASTDCAAACDTSVGCQLPDQGGHGSGGIIGATSDNNPDAGFQVADTFHPMADGSVASVCWWGMYIDFSGPADCGVDGPGTGDDFSITYYLDDGDGTTPGTVLAGPMSVAASAVATGNVIGSGIGDIIEYEYTASHDPVAVTGGACYWISIVNNTTETCFWLWETAPPGDERSAQNNSGWGAADYDLGFCVNVETAADGCGVFIGACCLTDGTCDEMSEVACLAAEGEYRGNGVTCADIDNCAVQPGACCLDETSCVDDFYETECTAFGGIFAGEGTLCADTDCADVGPDGFDQIGADDGSDLSGNITACQYFEAAYEQYDIATLDDFVFDDAGTVVSIEAVLNGWNGYVDEGPVTSYQVNVYSSPEAAAVNLVGDVFSADFPAAVLPPDWTGAGTLIHFDMSMDLAMGTYYFAVIPSNEFATNGQTGINGSNLGDGACWQANPNDGFGFGGLQSVSGNAAYRLEVTE